MRDVIKPGVVLFITALAAALVLCLIQLVTEDVIAQHDIDAKNKAMGEVLPGASGGMFGETVETGAASGVTSYNEGIVDGQVVGYALSVTAKGYGGALNLLVGVNADGVVEGVRLIAHTETPGLGANAKDDAFLDQFTGGSGTFSVTKSAGALDNEIQAITAATITTKAVTAGVNEALDFVKTLQSGGAK